MGSVTINGVAHQITIKPESASSGFSYWPSRVRGFPVSYRDGKPVDKTIRKAKQSEA